MGHRVSWHREKGLLEEEVTFNLWILKSWKTLGEKWAEGEHSGARNRLRKEVMGDQTITHVGECEGPVRLSVGKGWG